MTVSPKLRALFDEDVSPSDLFQDSVREIKLYARVPKRVKTEIPRRNGSTNSRLLSYKEIRDVEKRLIKEGLELKPKYSKGGRGMRITRKNIEERMGKLFEVIKEQVHEHTFFKTRMLMDSAVLQARVTDSRGYFNRTIHEDLRRLVEKGLVYRRGRGATSTYYLGDGREDAPCEEEKTSEERPEPEAKINSFDCLGVAYAERDECGECEAKEHCHDVQRRLGEAAWVEKKEVLREEPLIPRHVTVDINVTFRLGMR